MSGTGTVENEATGTVEVTERDTSTLSQGERDAQAWERLQSGDDPRAINYDLNRDADGLKTAENAAQVNATLQDETDDAGDEAEGGSPLTDNAGGGVTDTADSPDLDPGAIVLARRRLMRDYSPDEIAEFEQSLNPAKFVQFSDRAHAKNVDIDRMNNELKNPQAKGRKAQAEEDEPDDEAATELSERLDRLREHGFDDEADMLERAVEDQETYTADQKNRKVMAFLQTAVSEVEAKHKELATDKGKASLNKALDTLSKSGEYGFDDDGVQAWVDDAVSMCLGAQRGRQATLADDRTDPLDGQPDFTTENNRKGNKPPTREDRDRSAWKMLQAGLQPDEVQRRLVKAGA